MCAVFTRMTDRACAELRMLARALCGICLCLADKRLVRDKLALGQANNFAFNFTRIFCTQNHSHCLPYMQRMYRVSQKSGRSMFLRVKFQVGCTWLTYLAQNVESGDFSFHLYLYRVCVLLKISKIEP